MTCQEKAWKKTKQTLFSSISYCFFVSISFPNRLLDTANSLPGWFLPGQLQTAWEPTRIYWVPTSPACLPSSGQGPEVQLLLGPPEKHNTRAWGSHTQDAVGDIGLEKKHHLCNWNATDWICPEQPISPWLQQPLSLEHRAAPAQEGDWKHKNNKPGTIQQSKKEIKTGNYVVASYFLPKNYCQVPHQFHVGPSLNPYTGPIHTVGSASLVGTTYFKKDLGEENSIKWFLSSFGFLSS